MATITYPNTPAFAPERFSIELRANVLVSVSPLTGSLTTLQIPGSRWLFALQMPTGSPEWQAQREALLSKLEGQANRVTMWHIFRPVPRGTMRGAPVLASTALSGATTLSIQTTAGATLLAGDMLGVGAQLVQVVDDAQANGSGVLNANVRAALRNQANAGAAVTWDRPTALCVPAAPGVAVGYTSMKGGGYLLELMEAWV